MTRRDPWLLVGLVAFFGLVFLALFGERLAPHEAIYFVPEHGDDPRPHVRPVLLEGLGSGLRVSVASLPIIEYLFVWRGIGQLALESVGVHDAAGLIVSGVVLAGFFATVSALADVSRPRALFRQSTG